MENQQYSLDADSEASPLRVMLEIAGDDPALTNSVNLALVSTLQQEGYPLEWPYTGLRGGELQVFIEIGVQAFLFMKEHHALLSEGIQDLSGLVGIFVGVVPLCQKVVKAVQKQAPIGGNPTVDLAPLTITIEIDGQSISVESTDLAQVEAGLKLAQVFALAHPVTAKQAALTKSKVKLKGQVKRPPRQKPGSHC